MTNPKRFPLIIALALIAASMLAPLQLTAGPPVSDVVQSGLGGEVFPGVESAPQAPVPKPPDTVERGEARAAILTVCPAGPPVCDYSVIQDAVDAAGDGDTIKVAAGTYTGVHSRPVPPGYPLPPASGVITQVVYLTKTVTIRGGYTTTDGFAEPPDPLANPTILDAQGEGRVLLIAGEISATIEGVHLIGGDATGLGGGDWGTAYDGVGGGVFIREAAVTISRTQILSNTAIGAGGGVYLWHGDLALYASTISYNAAPPHYGIGGGLYAFGDRVTLCDSTVSHNVSSGGAGLEVWTSELTLRRNTIASNRAFTETSSSIIPIGGGLSMVLCQATLEGNLVLSNTASRAGGAFVVKSSVTLTNDIFADNTGVPGAGMQVWDPTYLRALHTTFARNREGQGVAIYCGDDPPSLVMSNTIVVSHSVGIYTEACTVTLEATLWGSGAWANGVDWYSHDENVFVTGTINLWEDPGFVDPDAGDYHIGPTSAATDAGVNAGVAVDIDGQARPYGASFDIGADELHPALRVTKDATPDLLQPGQSLTYTLRLTNTGYPVTLTATITDVLPAYVNPTGQLTWTVQVTAPGGAWAHDFTVTVDAGYTGPLTNVVRVRTEEGATGVYTQVVNVEEPIAGLAATNDSPTELGGPTTLTATVAAGNPVDYCWTFGDNTGSATGAVVSHAYPAVGVYNTVVTASNRFGWFTATTRVTITDVPIAGLVATNDSPTALGNPTALTATISAGSSVSYTWASGDGQFGSGATISNTYGAVDTYTAVVTASNSVGLLTATTLVAVEEPIAGLAAANDGPTALGSPTALTATVTTGDPVAYRWSFGDGDDGTGAEVAHTYPGIGIYAAVVTASNSVSELSATTWVTITDAPITGLVATNDSPTPLGDPTALTATISGGSSVTFTWAFGDDRYGVGATTIHTYSDVGIYTAVVTASNSVSLATATTIVTITRPHHFLFLPLVLKGETFQEPHSEDGVSFSPTVVTEGPCFQLWAGWYRVFRRTMYR